MSFTHLVSSTKLASTLTFGRNGAQNVYYYGPLRAAILSCASTWKSITREERALQTNHVCAFINLLSTESKLLSDSHGTLSFHSIK